jgi:hypothetical protein
MVAIFVKIVPYSLAPNIYVNIRIYDKYYSSYTISNLNLDQPVKDHHFISVMCHWLFRFFFFSKMQIWTMDLLCMHKEIRLDCIKNSNMRLKHRPLISRLDYNWFKIDSKLDVLKA